MTDGRDAERDVKEIYKRVGYEVYHPPKAKYRNQDVFEEFDLLSFRPGEIVGTQVKYGEYAQGFGPWFERVEKYRTVFDAVHFVHVTDDGFRLAVPDDEDGYRWELDTRGESEDSKLYAYLEYDE